MQEMSEVDGFLTTAEAAREIGVGRNMVINYCSRGLLPAKRVGKQYLIPLRAVKEFERPPVGNPAFQRRSARKSRRRAG